MVRDTRFQEAGLDWIELSDSRVQAIVGILPKERVSPQPMVLDVRLELDLQPIGDSGDLALGLDYAAVEAQLHAMARLGRFWLIESFALAAVRWLLLEPTGAEARGAVSRASVRVRKPTILDGRSTPGVGVQREAPVDLPRAHRDGVETVQLVRTDRDGVWRVSLEPGARWDPAPEQGVLVVAGTAQMQGVTVDAGTEIEAPTGGIVAAESAVTLLVAGTPVTDRRVGA